MNSSIQTQATFGLGRLRGFAILVLVSLLLLSACAGLASSPSRSLAPSRASGTRTCVYSGNKISGLWSFDRLVHTHVICAMVFDTDQPTWATWERPWFTDNPLPNENWVKFARRPGDQFIITVPLFPDQAQSQDWRTLGAAGAYTGYDRTLAKNLVASGMGDSIIRLAHEANGPWAPDNVGSTPYQWAEWKTFWRKTAIAMDSVPGAHFRFNWCISSGYRAIPFSAYYPGDDLVSSIGVDVYDGGEPANIPAGPGRWAYQYDQPGGVAAIAAFAKAHHKPLSIPEWGLEPTTVGGAGDDFAFVAGIDKLLHTTDVAFESYFYADYSGEELAVARSSLVEYRRMIHAS